MKTLCHNPESRYKFDVDISQISRRSEISTDDYEVDTINWRWEMEITSEEVVSILLSIEPTVQPGKLNEILIDVLTKAPTPPSSKAENAYMALHHHPSTFLPRQPRRLHSV